MHTVALDSRGRTTLTRELTEGHTAYEAHRDSHGIIHLIPLVPAMTPEQLHTVLAEGLAERAADQPAALTQDEAFDLLDSVIGEETK